SLFFALTAAWAQEPLYPQRGPVEITVLFPAGTSADVTARMLADGMARELAQRVLVVNRPGAGGAIGYKHVASQKADGYALVWNSNSISTTYHSGQMPFDYQAFDAVARVLVESPVVAVRADARWRTLRELLDDAKARPKAVSIGHSGVGSHTHLCLVALTHGSGVEMNEVPFAAAEVVPSLIGCHVGGRVRRTDREGRCGGRGADAGDRAEEVGPELCSLPREGGDPVFFLKRGSRFRGNDGGSGYWVAAGGGPGCGLGAGCSRA